MERVLCDCYTNMATAQAAIKEEAEKKAAKAPAKKACAKKGKK